MTEHGIIMSGPMVRAIAEGRKDQTRRIVTPQPWKVGEVNGQASFFWKHGQPGSSIETDYIHTDRDTVGRWIERLSLIEVGDILHVRESAMLASVGPGKRELALKFRADEAMSGQVKDYQWPEGEPNPYKHTSWTPAIHMPRWATRYKLQVLLVQAERLQDLTEADALREGIFRVEPSPGVFRYAFRNDVIDSYFSPVSAYEALWDGLNGERGFTWKSNPWVRVFTFRLINVPRGTS